jgi:hypothetical protein
MSEAHRLTRCKPLACFNMLLKVVLGSLGSTAHDTLIDNLSSDHNLTSNGLASARLFV